VLLRRRFAFLFFGRLLADRQWRHLMSDPMGARLSTSHSDGILDNHAPGPTILALVRVLARQAARDFYSTALAPKSGALPTHLEN
jgi:hypothetical protein